MWRGRDQFVQISYVVCVSITYALIGEVPKWPTGPDCKSGGSAFAGSNPALTTTLVEFLLESLLAQVVEHMGSKGAERSLREKSPERVARDDSEAGGRPKRGFGAPR